MSINKVEVAKKLERTILPQSDLRHREEIKDMMWLLTDEPDNYNIIEEVAKLINDERLKRGMTQAMLAERAGISKSHISEFARCVRVPHLDHLQKIAHAMGMRLKITFEEEPHKENKNAKSTRKWR